jgi:hypothetical protein
MPNSVTLWYRYDKTKDAFTFNHLEDGIPMTSTPTIKHPDQYAPWSASRWVAMYGTIDPLRRVTVDA